MGKATKKSDKRPTLYTISQHACSTQLTRNSHATNRLDTQGIGWGYAVNKHNRLGVRYTRNRIATGTQHDRNMIATGTQHIRNMYATKTWPDTSNLDLRSPAFITYALRTCCDRVAIVLRA